jgi:hypothetical protein
MFYLRANRTYYAGRFMSQRQWLLDKDVAIAVMIEIMKVRSTETGSPNSDLHLIRPWRLESSIFLSEY